MIRFKLFLLVLGQIQGECKLPRLISTNYGYYGPNEKIIFYGDKNFDDLDCLTESIIDRPGEYQLRKVIFCKDSRK
jgi:hypothetical protein